LAVTSIESVPKDDVKVRREYVNDLFTNCAQAICSECITAELQKPHLCFHTVPSYSGKLPVTDTRAAEFGDGFLHEAIKIVYLQLIEMSPI